MLKFLAKTVQNTPQKNSRAQAKTIDRDPGSNLHRSEQKFC
jgi:hypothetical protein